MHFRSFEHERSREDLGAKLGANGRSLQATPGHNQLTSVQLDGSVSYTRQHTAMLRRCLLSSGSRVRILPGALCYWVLGRSRPDLPNAQRDPSIPTKVVGYRLAGRRRGHGEDSIYWDESRKRYIGAVDLGLSPDGSRIRKKASGKTTVEVRDKLRELQGDRRRAGRPQPGIAPRNTYVLVSGERLGRSERAVSRSLSIQRSRIAVLR